MAPISSSVANTCDFLLLGNCDRFCPDDFKLNQLLVGNSDSIGPSHRGQDKLSLGSISKVAVAAVGNAMRTNFIVWGHIRTTPSSHQHHLRIFESEKLLGTGGRTVGRFQDVRRHFVRNTYSIIHCSVNLRNRDRSE